MNAGRAEIFGSTAAYAAVLVVFVTSPTLKSEAGNCTPVSVSYELYKEQNIVY